MKKEIIDSNTVQMDVYDQIKIKDYQSRVQTGGIPNRSSDIGVDGCQSNSNSRSFRMLESEGLLIYQPRRGWKVYTLTLNDINNIFEIKIVLEALIVRKASQCKDESARENLRKIINMMSEAQVQNDANSWAKLDIDLHHQIFAMAENDRAMNIIESLNEQWNRVRIGFSARTGRMARSIIEHKAIVDAILDRDADRAEREMVDHLENVWKELINLLENMVLPFAVEGV